MKKFLSLLLAMTMVMSLIVLPARAAGELTVSGFDVTLPDGASTTVENNTQVTVNAKKDGITVTDGENPITDATATYKWSVNGVVESSVTGEQFQKELTTNNETATVLITCEVTYTKDSKTGSASASKAFTVNNSAIQANNAFVTALYSSITYAGRTYRPDASKKITAYKFAEDADNATWNVPSTLTGYTNVSITANPGKNNGTLTITGKTTDTTPVDVTASFNCELSDATVSVTSNPSDKEVIVGGTLTLTASCVAAPSDAKYLWYVDSATTPASTKTSSFTLPADATVGTHSVKCVVKTNDETKKIAETTVSDIKVISNTFTIKVTANPISVTSTTTPVTVTAKMYNGETLVTDSAISNWRLVKTDATNAFTPYNYTSGNVMTLYATKSGSAYITATATYKGKTITTALNATVTSSLLSYTLPAIQSGSYGTYSNYNLLSYANTIAFVGRPVNGFQSISVSPQTDRNNLGVLTVSGSDTTAQYTFSNVNATRKVGVAQFTATAYSGSTPYTIYFNVPVEPTGTTYADQYPEPVASYGNTYRYYVQVPSGYSSYYVVGTPNQAVRPTDWSQGSSTVYYTNTTTTSLYPLTDSNFVNGKCTLWIVTADSYGRLSCGQLAVYQKNYNINYNGVAGETVQFKHADFTNFMNEVSQARGDASKTGSYPYVTFNYVTFNYPTSTQGTLYYNGTAMSNSSYSGSFNSRTQITNLDNVTFVPYARTSAKSIPLTFTLSVTKYGANGAVVNRDLKYTGTVVVSIVREDIKYTAAPGDTIRFTDSDFLNYLRTQNGFNSNYYSIDYVTFDQSAVNALNEGVLYAYSTGFNAVKTTDKFYYTTTSYNQNALSDVTFRASAYAKTGTTVYIPFTIYARYGTTGTGTRQVTGTVAIKLAQTMNFVDVKPTDYFYDSVKWAVNSNITKGTSATTFSPYKTCTRAEIVTFLWRAAGSKTPTITRNPFTDVAPSMGMDYYYAILWASQNGIAAGTSATTFSPNATCTRAQIVTFLWRYSNKPAGYYSNPFTDVNKAEHAAYYDAILWAVGKGITKGTTATTFSPYGTCTRGEAVTFLYRAVNGK